MAKRITLPQIQGLSGSFQMKKEHQIILQLFVTTEPSYQEGTEIEVYGRSLWHPACAINNITYSNYIDTINELIQNGYFTQNNSNTPRGLKISLTKKGYRYLKDNF